MTDLNIESELLINCVECLPYHNQSKNEVRPVVTTTVESDAAPGQSI